MPSQMLAWSRRLCVVACLAASTAHAQSQVDKLSLCTARADGNYYAAGEAIRSRLNADRLQLALIETAGSVER